jgi:hypothetical protein
MSLLIAMCQELRNLEMMKRLKQVEKIRSSIKLAQPTIGSWMQNLNSEVAEISGQACCNCGAIDMEQASISVQQLPSLFRPNLYRQLSEVSYS